ncbi:MAG TPA: copper resistance system multicopper oxidase [Rhodopila sp.]|uniref:copper resistance system multicopper oxidase n=1 Tax=Rhodopila sp. TaxID=2480087 RepID=UPI002B524189|nr:copper resistance system multicopper oxidase [Rhodopila sp.]HVY16193.1 copper resistance system multicopper oxidase [Rhodopila sp.]
MSGCLNRRALLRGVGAVGGSLALDTLMPAWARNTTPGLAAGPVLSGPEIQLTIDQMPFAVGGRTGRAVAVNGSVPGPLIRLREGQKLKLVTTNKLDEPTSVHKHGILVPFQFDGVPGVTFPGIAPGETIVEEFPIIQSGTYWYHSHSNLQEQIGHYGPIVIDPAGPDPVAYDREHVLVLSDWTSMDPHMVMARLKAEPGYFNFRKQALVGLLSGKDQPLEQRLMWARMRMDPTDISDVTGSTYTYLINGRGPEDNWTALFRPGERVRLRIINASAMTMFNVRIPGLSLDIVQADGQDVRPVAVDEFQIGVAETYDIVVRPMADKAFAFVAEAIDRSGMGRATLAPRPGMTAAVPPLRRRPLATMADMGMGGMNTHGGGRAMPEMDHSAMPGMNMDDRGQAMPGMDMGGMGMREPANAPQVKMTPGVQTILPMPVDRTNYPGLGLDDVGHKVLAYTDLVALEPNPDPRPYSRTLEIHLTGNMERFMWSFDGVKFSEVKAPIPFRRDERVRVTLVNDTMMVHPIHLHGHFFEVVNGHSGRHPRKHTVNVQPGGKVSFDLTANAPGDWAFHCHLLYHMHAGMFQVVTVRPLDGGAA